MTNTPQILLILGHPRSGKTTLTNMVLKKHTGGNVISMDVIARTFGAVFPEVAMHLEPEKSENTFAKFLSSYITNMVTEFPNRKFIVEGCHITPTIASKMLDGLNYKIVVLGCANMTPKQFVTETRKNDKKSDWTSQKDDAELLQIAECFTGMAKNLETECKDFGIQFIDTSFDRNSKFKKFMLLCQ